MAVCFEVVGSLVSDNEEIRVLFGFFFVLGQ